jgi:hypothetical protein
MAETDKKEAPKPAETKAADEPTKTAQPPPAMWMRALLGFAGLSLLVGFFLPWVRVPAVEDGADATTHSGLDLAFSTTGIEGTPAIVVLIVPILGALLSAIAFMGFRYAAQTAVGVAVAMIAYALYVLASMFVQNTALGLWVVSGGTFVTLLLGVATWMLARRAAEGPSRAKAQDAAKK